MKNFEWFVRTRTKAGVPGFTIGTLKADRKKGEVSTNKVSISFTIDEKGNAEFDRNNLEEKDKAESTVQR